MKVMCNCTQPYDYCNDCCSYHDGRNNYTCCPECGREMNCYSHFCEGCKERVAVPDDGCTWLKYFKEKYKLGVKENG